MNLLLALFFFSSVVSIPSRLFMRDEATALSLIGQTSQSTDFDSYQDVSSRFQNWPNSSFLICTPELQIEDKINYKYPIVCQLAQAPSEPVYIFFEAYGLKFSQCWLKFGTDNQPQTVIVIPQPEFHAVQAQNIYALAYGCQEPYNNHTMAIPILRDSLTPAYCYVWGDPHIVTFNMPISQYSAGTELTFRGSGDYILVDSKAGLRILASYFECSAGVTCVNATTVQYYDSLYYFIANPVVGTFNMSSGSNTHGTELPASTDPTNSQTINLEDGSTITVTSASLNSFTYLNIQIWLSGIHYDKVQGQCGYWNNYTDANSVSCNGTYYFINQIKNNASDWGNCWAVQDASMNCLRGNCPTIPNETTCMDTIPEFCLIPTIPTPIPPRTCTSPTSVIDTQASATPTSTDPGYGYQFTTSTASVDNTQNTQSTSMPAYGYQVPTTTATVENTQNTQSASIAYDRYTSAPGYQPPTTASPSVENTLNTQSPTSVDPCKSDPVLDTAASQPTCTIQPSQATDLCNQVFQNYADFQTNVKNVLLQTCIYDMLNTCSLDITVNYQISFQQHCLTVADMLTTSYNYTNRVVAGNVYASFGFGNNTCPNDCNNMGTCGSMGCQCNQGYAGSYCEVELSQYNALSNVTNTTGYGSNFTTSQTSEATPLNNPFGGMIYPTTTKSSPGIIVEKSTTLLFIISFILLLSL